MNKYLTKKKRKPETKTTYVKWPWCVTPSREDFLPPVLSFGLVSQGGTLTSSESPREDDHSSLTMLFAFF